MDDIQFLEFLIKALVEHPDDVKIKRTVDEMGVLMTLDVHPDDMGKVIGRAGNTAKAIRILLRVVGMKNNARVNLKINEPLGHRPTGEALGNRPTSGYSSAEGSSESIPATYSSPAHSQPSASKTVDEAMEDLNLD